MICLLSSFSKPKTLANFPNHAVPSSKITTFRKLEDSLNNKSSTSKLKPKILT